MSNMQEIDLGKRVIKLLDSSSSTSRDDDDVLDDIWYI
jgi:hypothetical protein